MTNELNVTQKRILGMFIALCFVFVALIFRLGWIQVVNSDKYIQIALNQQTKDIPIPAKRGIIFDRKGKELAISATTSTVWARPKEVDVEQNKEAIATSLSAILEIDADELIEKLDGDPNKLVRVDRWVNYTKSKKVRESNFPGIWLSEDNKRYYPFGSFAARLIGHTTDDNRGIVGVELAYEKYLSGLSGRMIQNTDASGRQLSYGTEKYFQEENGLNIVLTIDEVIQHFTEKTIKEGQIATNANRIMAIVMDPKTGELLAMASYPNYDLNEPRVPVQEDALAFYNTLSSDEKQNYWNRMWKNPIISDVYEPGSTFKLITAAVALEENIATPETEFYCNAFSIVAGITLKCYRYPFAHGIETLTEGVANSCNPVFIALSGEIGKDKFYEYIKSFGFMDVTGIGLPGETNSLVQSKSKIGPVELATMTYGQGIAVTPIQLISAISAFGNEGKIMEPHIIKGFNNDDGEEVFSVEPKIVRQVVSEETAYEVTMMMEAVVTEGGGKNAQITGYRIGGKTGTADKPVNGTYVEDVVITSFIGLAPIDDPQIAVLVIVDEPKESILSSTTAVPMARQIIENTLRYLNVPVYYTNDDLEKMENQYVYVPYLIDLSVEDAIEEIEGNYLTYETMPQVYEESFIVLDQYPKPGEYVKKGTPIILYK